MITVQQKVQDRFEAVYTRIQEGRGIVRQRPVDYLVYRLLEAVILPYGEALSHMEDQLDALEQAVVHEPSPTVMTQVLQLKRDLTLLRRALIPMKEVLGNIETSAFIKVEHHPYFRDVRDQAMQCIDRMDSLRSMLDSLESLYLSSVGQRTNEVMRVLTVFSAIFLPITFLAGLYGMNFQNMPETETQNGYFRRLSGHGHLRDRDALVDAPQGLDLSLPNSEANQRPGRVDEGTQPVEDGIDGIVCGTDVQRGILVCTARVPRNQYRGNGPAVL